MFKFLFAFLLVQQAFSKEPIHLEWTKVDEGIYNIQISTDQNFDSLVENKEIETNFFKFKNYSLGQYFWRVKVKYKGADKWLYTTKPGYIHIALRSLQAKGPESKIIDLDSGLASFSWHYSQHYPYYKIKIFEEGSNKPLVEESVLKKSEFETFLPAGRYSWQVVHTNGEGETLQVSDLQKFEFNSPEELSKESEGSGYPQSRFHFEAGVSFGQGSLYTEAQSEAPKNQLYELGLTGGYFLISSFYIGATASFQKVFQSSDSDKSHGNREGKRLELLSPTLGFRFFPLYLKLEYSLSGDYQMDQKTAAGKELSYSQTNGYRVSVFYESLDYPAFGVYYEDLIFKKEHLDSKSSSLDDGLKVVHFGISAAWFF